MLQTDHTLPADRMVHGADNDRLLAPAVVVVEADLALRDVLQLLDDGVRSIHSYYTTFGLLYIGGSSQLISYFIGGSYILEGYFLGIIGRCMGVYRFYIL